jgi:hypothetical protein
MNFDLDQLAKRLTAAAQRAAGMDVSVSGFDLILSKDGHGTHRSESVPFAALFLSDRDLLGQALDRLHIPPAQSKTQTSNEGGNP